MSPVPTYTPGWRETMWGQVSCLRTQHSDNVPIYTSGWRETMWSKVSCLRTQHSENVSIYTPGWRETMWRKQKTKNNTTAEARHEPPTFRLKVQRANRWTTAPPQILFFCECFYFKYLFFELILWANSFTIVLSWANHDRQIKAR